MIALVPVYPVVRVWCLMSQWSQRSDIINILRAQWSAHYGSWGHVTSLGTNDSVAVFGSVQSISVHNSLGDQMPGNIVGIVTSGISGGGAGISYKHCKHHNNHQDNAM